MLQSLTASIVPVSEPANFARYLGKQRRISLAFYLGEGAVLAPVKWTLNATIQNMSVDHCSGYFLVLRQLPHARILMPRNKKAPKFAFAKQSNFIQCLWPIRKQIASGAGIFPDANGTVSDLLKKPPVPNASTAPP